MTADPTEGVRLFNVSLGEYSGANRVLSLDATNGLDMLAYQVVPAPWPGEKFDVVDIA
jgi:hypothetical protein